MRIGIDARNIKPNIKSGLGRYTHCLIKNIARLDRDNQYILIKSPLLKHRIISQENFSEVTFSPAIDSVRNCLWGSNFINRLNLDLYHGTYHFLPRGLKCKVVITLHDLIWVDTPELSVDDLIRKMVVHYFGKIFIKRALIDADHIISVSRASMERALINFDLDERKFTIIHHGVDENFFAHKDEWNLPERLTDRPYIICLGHTRPYKNIPRVIDAFKMISSKYPDLLLVISGRGDYYKMLRRKVKDQSLLDRVIFIGILEDDVIFTIFKHAKMLAFPSLVEGFGIPLIEAMTLGCPVLTSNLSSMPEVVGDAGLLVNPFSTEEIARGMESILTNYRLRGELIEKGKARARNYSVENLARETLNIYTVVGTNVRY